MSDPQNQNPELQPAFTHRGLVLKEPHASWIYLGVKDSIVSTEDYSSLLNNELLLVGERAYGKIKLKEQSTITIDEFRESINSHKISESERKDWAKDDDGWLYGPLHKYTFVFEPFEIPMMYQKPKVKKSVLDAVILKEEVVDDFIFKPEGPWGDGFKECIAWVKRNKPGVENPQAWCAEVYHRQKGAEKKEMDKEGRLGNPRTDEERAKEHFNISDEEWERLSEEEKQDYIKKLPPRGTTQKSNEPECVPCSLVIKYYLEERPSGYYLVHAVNDKIEKELRFRKDLFTYEDIIDIQFVKDLLMESNNGD